MNTADTILDYWFGPDPDRAALAKDRAELWWSKNPAADDKIRQRFESSIKLAADGKLNAWLAQARGRLALILLIDQFPRNIHRDSPRAFAFDAQTLMWSVEGIELGVDRWLRPIERTFFYLPLEHSERLEHQERSVRMFRDLLPSVAADQRDAYSNYLNFAIRHHDIIARFGRFPHRNEILGRSSTLEELIFLSQPGSKF